jgi:hypothetical protein
MTKTLPSASFLGDLVGYGARPRRFMVDTVALEVWAVITDVVRKGIACTLLPPRELRRKLNARIS